MKAQRRHELQTNTLAQVLSDLPLYLRFHFGKIVLGLLIVVLVVLLVRHRIQASRTRGQEAIGSLNQARILIERLPILDLVEPDVNRRASERQRMASQAEGFIQTVLDETQDPEDAALRAETYVTRGNLYWTLANLTEIPGSTTQPSLAMPHSSDQYLSQAEEAYEHVLRNYRERTLSAAGAMFALAAIAENRQQWDAAMAQYDAILQLPSLPPLAKAMAGERRQFVEHFKEPLYTGTVTSQPTTEPATQPATQPAS